MSAVHSQDEPETYQQKCWKLEQQLTAAQSRIRVQDEAMQQLEARCAMLEDISFKAVNALQFYADEETWFATTLRPDRPAGEINDDYGETENLGVKPGRRARQAFDEIHVIAKNLSESDWLARNNNEVLELAAKAAGIEYQYGWRNCDGILLYETTLYLCSKGRSLRPWNPLKDDGDALRLAVKLHMDIENDHPECCIINHNSFGRDFYVVEYYKNSTDAYAATRRAIVRAAAEIGRNMK